MSGGSLTTDALHEEIAARRARIIAANPQAKARILGVFPYRTPEKVHRIEVDIPDGTRRIDSQIVVTTPPCAPTENPFRPRVTTGTCLRKDAQRIIDAVAARWDMSRDDLMGGPRCKHYSWPRFAAFRIIKDRLGWTRWATARAFGQHHTTIIHGLDRAAVFLVENADWRTRYHAALSELDKP